MWHASPAFTTEEQASIESAAATMSVRTGVCLQVVFDDDGTRRILKQHPPDPAASGQIQGDRIYIMPGLYPDRVKVIAMHELGHAVGMNHVAHGLMQPTTGFDTDWTPDDIAECHRIGLCFNEGVDPCR